MGEPISNPPQKRHRKGSISKTWEINRRNLLYRCCSGGGGEAILPARESGGNGPYSLQPPPSSLVYMLLSTQPNWKAENKGALLIQCLFILCLLSVSEHTAGGGKVNSDGQMEEVQHKYHFLLKMLSLIMNRFTCIHY